MKQKFFDLCRKVWASVVFCFDEYGKMKRQQLMKMVEADDAGDHDRAVKIAEEL